MLHEQGCDFSGEFAYVGRTTQTLEQRLSQHKSSARHGSQHKEHAHMTERGPDNFIIRPLEIVEGAVRECVLSERWWTNFLEAGLNTQRAGAWVLGLDRLCLATFWQLLEFWASFCILTNLKQLLSFGATFTGFKQLMSNFNLFYAPDAHLYFKLYQYICFNR